MRSGFWKIRTAARLALTLGMIAASLTWVAVSLGIITNPMTREIKNRIALTKSVALGVTSHAENRRSINLSAFMKRSVSLNKNVVSLGVRRSNFANYVAVAGPHEQSWVPGQEKSPNQLSVEILTNGRPWGMLEITFSPIAAGLLFGFPLTIILFVASTTTLTGWWVLSKTFKYLNPTQVVPDRVRSALDTLAEGLVLIDPKGEIAHANQAFAKITNRKISKVLGSKLEVFDWKLTEYQSEFPWQKCLLQKEAICGEIVEFHPKGMVSRKFVVNSTPIISPKGDLKGILTSFDDVTELEKKNLELASMIKSLRNSRDEISKQNEKLNFLASYDPLTTCMNRRAFFGKFETMWADESIPSLTLMILDVDHFKAVNDNHGHSVGDEVLKATGKLLRDHVGDKGLVCRYGGEEFVILLPGLPVDECFDFADELRKIIEVSPAAGVSYTASFGLSSREFGAMDPQHMLDQADECLYSAKRQGRNRVVRFDQKVDLPPEADESDAETDEVPDPTIAYSAVTGLLSALSFRCKDTAEHSIRVADLCVGVGKSLMNQDELYLLEIAALLHDVGKIGVPDSVRHKPGKLDDSEWEIMRKHDAIGVEIVRSSFASESITQAIESHHYCFTKRATNYQQVERGEKIPLAARIITVCDAFDAMINDRVYRKAMEVEDAIAELKKNAPAQFDPLVVAKLVEFVRAGGLEISQVASGDWANQSGDMFQIGKYVEDLQTAVSNEDIDSLLEVVTQLKQDSIGIDSINSVADRLNDALQANDKDIDSVLDIADEMMMVCRSSRLALVGMASNIVEGNPQ